jgi:hypothetical protein
MKLFTEVVRVVLEALSTYKVHERANTGRERRMRVFIEAVRGLEEALRMPLKAARL